MSTHKPVGLAPANSRTARSRRALRARRNDTVGGATVDNDLPIAGYLRLTVDRDGNKIGYDVQRGPIEAWAQAEGKEIIWYQDKDLTAADRSVFRKDYERMLVDIQEGRVGGIAVWRLDRLVRLAREFERCFGVVEDANRFIVITAAGAKVDTREPAGLMIMRMMVNVAEMEIAAMKARQVGHQRLKAEKGEYSGGGIRAFGFVGAVKDDTGHITNRGQLMIAHHPIEADLIREAAKRITQDGERYADVVKDWIKRDIRGTQGAFFSSNGLQDVLLSPRTAGKRDLDVVDPETGEVKTYYYKAVWEPILDEETWQKLLGMKTFVKEKGRPFEYLLTGGFVLCGRCKRPLHGATRTAYQNRSMQAPVKQQAYRCPSSPKEKALGSCGGLNVLATPVDDLVIAFALSRLSNSKSWLPTDDPALKNSDIEAALTVISDAERDLQELARMAALPEGHADKLTIEEWKLMRRDINSRKEAATKKVQTLSRALSVPSPTPADRENLEQWFEDLSRTQQRKFIGYHIASVEVLPTPVRGRHAWDLSRVVITAADHEQLA